MVLPRRHSEVPHNASPFLQNHLCPTRTGAEPFSSPSRLANVHGDTPWLIVSLEWMPVRTSNTEAVLTIVKVWASLALEACSFNGEHATAVATVRRTSINDIRNTKNPTFPWVEHHWNFGIFHFVSHQRLVIISLYSYTPISRIAKGNSNYLELLGLRFYVYTCFIVKHKSNKKHKTKQKHFKNHE